MTHPSGVTNFFKLISSLDSEKINPFGDATIQKNIASLEFPGLFEQLSPRFERMGVDMPSFRDKLFYGADELKRAWSKFITNEAEKVLTKDFVGLIELSKNMIHDKKITSTEVNTIIGFTIMYFDVIENKKINKKDVVEGVLMKGLIKKSSFYQKIAMADKDYGGVLSWDEKSDGHDMIWQHFVLQTCRFLKQTIHNLNHFIHDGKHLKSEIQSMIDQGEFEQFKSKGRRGNKQYFFMLTLLFGLTTGVISFQQYQQKEAPLVPASNVVELKKLADESAFQLSSNRMFVSHDENSKDAVLLAGNAYGPHRSFNNLNTGTPATHMDLYNYLRASEHGGAIDKSILGPGLSVHPNHREIVHGREGGVNR